MTGKESQTTKIIRKLRGIVVSDKMDKTTVVKVDRTKVHPKYKKRYVVSKKYKVHDPKNECRVDDYVEFSAGRPVSKDKRWKLSEIIKKAPVVEALPEVESELKHKEREEQRIEAKKEAETQVETVEENAETPDSDQEDSKEAK